jgi:nitroimidazol reductase NimA-like FMN-containing flavoprotein (pyridoxamine 5'-phosphate oxidase superfamily)
MVIQAMTSGECWTMLARNNIARLACARDNQPYIVPLRVDLDGQFLYGYTSLGRKVEWMRTNPLVCLECEELTSDRVWATLVVFGRYEELPRTPEHEEARQVADRLFQKRVMWWEPATVPLAGQERHPPIVFRIRIDSVTGRRTVSEPESREGAVTAEPRTPRWIAQLWRRLRGEARDWSAD